MSKIYLKIAIFVFIFIIAWFIGFILFTNSIFSYSTPKILDNTPNTGITVLTGGRNRIAKAIDLLNNKKGTRLLISGVKKQTTLQDIISREDVKLESDLPIDLGYLATDTVGNAKEIKQWAIKHKIEKIYVVTSFYHIPRSRLEIEHELKDKDIQYIPTPSKFVSRKWWKNFRSFKFLANEYTKFLIVFSQYKVLGILR